MTPPIVEIKDLGVRYGDVQAVANASIALETGEILGIVGESGSGKTTLIRAIMGLAPISAGQTFFSGADVTYAKGKARRDFWTNIQMVFQDPAAALSPRLTIAEAIAEPMEAQGMTKRDIAVRIHALMQSVGLPHDMLDRRPKALSGGQRQRVAIARALALKPSVIVADEPMSALDVSVKAQIAALFVELRAQEGISFIIVAHDLALLGQVADRLVVMHQGHIVEEGPARQIIDAPQHAYTSQLRDACLDPLAIAQNRFAASQTRL